MLFSSWMHLGPSGWKRADEINIGDWVRRPVRPITRTIERFRGTHLMRSKREDRGQRFWVNLNPAWGYMCGLYLAEGSCHGNHRFHTENAKATGLVFSIHEKEMAAVRERLIAAFGREQYIGESVRKDSFSAKLTVSVSHLARWVRNNFGDKDQKRIPDWVWSAGKDFCAQLVKGYFDGDGHYVPDGNEVRASSIRVALPLQMRDLIASLGFGWSSIYYRAAGVYYERNCKQQWTIALSGSCGSAFREYFGMESFPFEDAHYWKYDMLKENVDIQVETIGDGFSTEFYDIEVDHPSHSFVTEQCAVHNSELADIPDPQKTIEEGLFRAMHTSPNLFMVLEGTGGGNTGWLADTWRSAKKNWPLGMSRLCPVFISWPMCPEIYPKEGWLKKFPVPGDFLERRLESTAKHVAKCEAYIRNTPYLAKVMGRDYIMPFEQQWFYEFNYRQACENHTQKTWQSQMPADDFEALTGEHDPVFDLEVIDGIEGLIYEIQGNDKTRKIPVQAYAITGHDVDDAFYPREDQIDDSEPIIEISWNSNRGQTYEWQLVPLLPLSEDEEVNTMDRLLVYEPPKRGSMYTCGIDTADGLGQEDEDRTVLSLSKNLFDGDSDRQACELTSNRLNAAQAVAFAACIGAWYGPACRDSRGVRFAIEQIGRPGETCQHQLKMMGFSWHYIPKRFDQKKIKADIGGKEGWWSSSWSVSILMTRFVEAVNGGWYVPKSRWLIEELRTLERHTKTGKSKMEHRAGQHDDRVRAAAQSYFCAHDMDILAERAQKKHAGPPKKNDNRPRPKAGDVGIGSWDD